MKIIFKKTALLSHSLRYHLTVASSLPFQGISFSRRRTRMSGRSIQNIQEYLRMHDKYIPLSGLFYIKRILIYSNLLPRERKKD